MERTKIFRAVRMGTASLLMLASLFVVGLWIRSHYREDLVAVRVTYNSGFTFLSAQGSLGVLFVPLGPEQDKVFHIRSVPSGEVPLSRRVATTLGFLFAWMPAYRGSVLIVPSWFLLFAFGGVGLALLKQWFSRFTIRSVLVLTTIVAIVLGLMMHKPS